MGYEIEGVCPDCFSFRYQTGGCPDCGYVDMQGKSGAQTLPPGTLLGNRYLLGRVLGIGGFGITYKAYDTLYQEVCAVKEFAPSGLVYRKAGCPDVLLHNRLESAYYQHGMKRFIEEAQMLKRLEGVPAVVQVKECFQENQTAYFAMEFLDGTNLKKVVKTMGNSIAAQDILNIMAEIGSAMAVIHRMTGILHRDISPENIYLQKDGTVKLLDFGSARQQALDERQEYSVQFKHGFAPPEQYTRTGKQGTYTDVYALASTCYYSLTGVMVPGAMDRLDQKNYEPLDRLRQEILPEISAALDRALVLDYRARTQTMEEFVHGISPETRTIGQDGHLADQRRVPFLEVLTGTRAGVCWKLPADTKVNIGRSLKMSNIMIDGNPMISKVHCSLIYDSGSGEFLLCDFSRNGVFVDQKRLEREKTYTYPQEVQFSLASRECTIKAGVTYE